MQPTWAASFFIVTYVQRELNIILYYWLPASTRLENLYVLNSYINLDFLIASEKHIGRGIHLNGTKISMIALVTLSVLSVTLSVLSLTLSPTFGCGRGNVSHTSFTSGCSRITGVGYWSDFQVFNILLKPEPMLVYAYVWSRRQDKYRVGRSDLQCHHQWLQIMVRNRAYP